MLGLRLRHCVSALLAAGTLSVTTLDASASEPPAYTLFESGHVRPLALSPDGKHLFAVNTPDGRLEIFAVNQGGLVHEGSVPVGVDPVAVAARSNDEVWVVNHVSDSVSIVDVSDAQRARVVRTLLVGDEPRDIVFAGTGRRRAFITTAHRGQNSPIDPQFTTPGVGRADVWVFDAAALGSTLAGTPLTIVTLFSDTPRALAVSPDGNTVYAAAFHSGNRTTAVSDLLVPDGGEAAGGVPGPNTNFQGFPQPEAAVIVKHDGAHWVDVLGRTWDNSVMFSLPDRDVFAINARANPPAQIPGAAGFYTGVGTILYNMAVNPVNGKIYVSNTDALNDTRFEGAGIFAGETLRGHQHESRITVLSPGNVRPRHLNKHIDYGSCCAPLPNTENGRSLALPQGMAVTSDGATLYVAALGSQKVGVFSTAALENDTFVPSAANHIPLSGGGPGGLVLDEARKRLYVLTRFDNAVSVIDTVTRTEKAHVPMFNPEPAHIVEGRPFLYDAAFTSSHGDSACATCHVFGDFDSLAWDLGNPDAMTINNPGPFLVDDPDDPNYRPLKGPMTTQSLRGMANHGPMHWRGDRTGGNDEPSLQPDSGIFDERAAFEKFNEAFVDLLGRHTTLSTSQMESLTDFVLEMTYPPNPVRALDNALTPDQQAGLAFFSGPLSDVTHECRGCHELNPAGNPGSARPGFFGTSGLSTFEGTPQTMKVPHLRNMYQKIGMFGMAEAPGIEPGDNGFQGDQVRGFGYLHDGVIDTIFRFMKFGFGESALNPEGFPTGPAGTLLRRQVESYLLAFDSNMAPIVGQQVTLAQGSGADVHARIHLLRGRADAGECDLVVKGRFLLQERGFLYRGGGVFETDHAFAPFLPDAALRLLATLLPIPLTYTCVPPGSGKRFGIDRDGDGFRDGDERLAGTDPADPSDP
ncbi:beta-propeller fold lactonase family protein [Chondromyces apiculatus]|nr:beta-propeller fold lactonase family protein [Chondromyces apiculatus]